jgi:hypothetical protein
MGPRTNSVAFAGVWFYFYFHLHCVVIYIAKIFVITSESQHGKFGTCANHQHHNQRTLTADAPTVLLY